MCRYIFPSRLANPFKRLFLSLQNIGMTTHTPGLPGSFLTEGMQASADGRGACDVLVIRQLSIYLFRRYE